MNYGSGSVLPNVNNVSIATTNGLAFELPIHYSTSGSKSMVVTINDGIIPISRPFQFNVVANQAPTVVSPAPSLLLTPQTTNRDYYSDLRQAFADVDNPGTLQWLMTVPASGTASSEVADGQTFTVDFIGTYNVFEFDSSSPASTTPANIPNPITAVQSATGVRESINSVLNSTG